MNTLNLVVMRYFLLSPFLSLLGYLAFFSYGMQVK